VPSGTTATVTGDGYVEFVGCGISSIEVKCIYDNDPGTTENWTEFFVNGVSVAEQAPSSGGVYNKFGGATADGEATPNDRNTKYTTLPLVFCTNVIRIVGHAAHDSSVIGAGNTKQRVDVFAVTPS
jgi:hypothetical protein